MSHKQAGKLIIENIQMLDEAARLLRGDLSQEIFDEIDKLVQEKVSTFTEDWDGTYTFDEDGVYFAPEAWKAVNTKQFRLKDYYARYVLSYENIDVDNNHTEFWLTGFFSNSFDEMVFKFVPWFNCYARCTNGLWKKFASIQNEKYPEIESLGFKYSAKEGEWYLPIASLNQQLVADCYVEDNLADAMEPITEALDKLYQAHPYFDKIVETAKDQVGVNVQD